MEQLLGYAMLATVPWALWMRWSLHRQVRSAADWPVADGEIIASDIGTATSTSAGNVNTVYRAKIIYRYEAAGRPRENNRICIGGQLQLSWKSKALEYCHRYPVGKQVIVHYNPRKPGDAVLEVREEISWFYLVAAAAAAVIGYNFI